MLRFTRLPAVAHATVDTTALFRPTADATDRATALFSGTPDGTDYATVRFSGIPDATVHATASVGHPAAPRSRRQSRIQQQPAFTVCPLTHAQEDHQ
jgi:hypothetical protein